MLSRLGSISRKMSGGLELHPLPQPEIVDLGAPISYQTRPRGGLRPLPLLDGSGSRSGPSKPPKFDSGRGANQTALDISTIVLCCNEAGLQRGWEIYK